MISRKDIYSAVRRRDGITIRKMALQAQKEETRMFLSLLADLVERDLKKVNRKAA